jgi:hypothetical protein
MAGSNDQGGFRSCARKMATARPAARRPRSLRNSDSHPRTHADSAALPISLHPFVPLPVLDPPYSANNQPRVRPSSASRILKLILDRVVRHGLRGGGRAGRGSRRLRCLRGEGCNLILDRPDFSCVESGEHTCHSHTSLARLPALVRGSLPLCVSPFPRSHLSRVTLPST